MVYFARIEFGRFALLESERRAAHYQIYFIKIGASVNPSKRIKEHRHVYCRPIRLLAVMPGSFEEEAAMHERFSGLRIDPGPGAPPAELFHPGRDLMDFIRSIQEKSRIAS